MNASKIALPGLPPSSVKLIRPNRCEACKFFEKQHPAHQHGECHKNPPMASIIPTNKGPQTLSAFPLVQPTQWCGAFETKIAAVN
jgi:hypothetical protein